MIVIDKMPEEKEVRKDKDLDPYEVIGYNQALTEVYARSVEVTEEKITKLIEVWQYKNLLPKERHSVIMNSALSKIICTYLRGEARE